MLNALGAAGLGVLVFDPHAVFGASFQLTFLSVLIIAAIGIPVLERTTQPFARGLRLLQFTSYDLHVPTEVAQFRLDLRLIAGRLKRFGQRAGLILPGGLMRITLAGGELLFISALMQAGLALPMAYYFCSGESGIGSGVGRAGSSTAAGAAGNSGSHFDRRWPRRLDSPGDAQ